MKDSIFFKFTKKRSQLPKYEIFNYINTSEREFARITLDENTVYQRVGKIGISLEIKNMNLKM